MARSALSDELFLNWEGYEEQLGEAEFLWGQRERQLFSPDYRLPQVAEREERLLASEDVLVLGGVAVARGVLVPALASETPARIATAAHALLTGGAPGAAEAVREALEGEAEGVAPAVTRALELVETNNLPAWLPRLLDAPSAPLKTLALGALGPHGTVPHAELPALLKHEDAHVVSAAVHALAHAPRPQAPARETLQRLLASPVPEVRDAAVEWGLATGQRAAWATCEALLATPDAHLPRLVWALGGDEKQVQKLVILLDNSALRAAALWALGFSGQLPAMDACVECMGDEATAALAAEAFSAMTGLHLEGRYTVPRPEDSATVLDENPEANVRRGMEDMLPLPHPSAVAAWWKENRARFSAGQRYLLGRPLEPATLLEALETAPMRHRHALALEAALRSRGVVRIPTRAWVRQQLAALRAARALGDGPLARPFTEGLS